MYRIKYLKKYSTLEYEIKIAYVVIQKSKKL